MAKKNSQGAIERTYTIPLSRELLKVPYYRKAKKAARVVRAFIAKHMKSENVLIGRQLNMKLWEHGIKNPPKNVKVTTTRDDKGVVRVELFGAPIEAPKVDKKKKSSSKETEAKTEEKSHQKAEKLHKAEAQEKEEIAELKKEIPHKQHHAPKQPVEAHFEEIHPRAPKSP